MSLDLNQLKLASLRTVSLENRTGRHGNSRQHGNKTDYRVYWRKKNCGEASRGKARFGTILRVHIVGNLK